MMTPTDSPDGAFSLSEARHIVKDLFKPRPVVYWTDFLLSMSVGGYSFYWVRGTPATDDPVAIRFALPAYATSNPFWCVERALAASRRIRRQPRQSDFGDGRGLKLCCD